MGYESGAGTSASIFTRDRAKRTIGQKPDKSLFGYSRTYPLLHVGVFQESKCADFLVLQAGMEELCLKRMRQTPGSQFCFDRRCERIDAFPCCLVEFAVDKFDIEMSLDLENEL